MCRVKVIYFNMDGTRWSTISFSSGDSGDKKSEADDTKDQRRGNELGFDVVLILSYIPCILNSLSIIQQPLKLLLITTSPIPICAFLIHLVSNMDDLLKNYTISHHHPTSIVILEKKKISGFFIPGNQEKG